MELGERGHIKGVKVIRNKKWIMENMTWIKPVKEDNHLRVIYQTESCEMRGRKKRMLEKLTMRRQYERRQ